jgi:predicted carbohydrate-binding protein with CBM5 and CBM33 domain
VTLLLDFENAPSDPFIEFSNANIDINGSVVSINIPEIEGGEIISANVLVQDAPESFPAEGVAVVSNNEVVQIVITEQGQGYVTAPTITITSDTLSGRVLLEDLTTLVDDGNRYANNDPQANNELFQNELDFIDFSEFNPFSEGDRW